MDTAVWTAAGTEAEDTGPVCGGGYDGVCRRAGTERCAANIGLTMKNKVLRRNAMDGVIVVAIDGAEQFHSSKKELPGALERTYSNGIQDDCCKSVAAMTAGGKQKVIPGQTMLRAGDGDAKDEGELTGAHRLQDELHDAYGCFGDVLGMDALYLNAPLLKHADEPGMKVVVRLKGEKRRL